MALYLVPSLSDILCNFAWTLTLHRILSLKATPLLCNKKIVLSRIRPVLIRYKVFDSIEDAIMREKQIKAGSRKRKEDLVNALNAEWRDLFWEVQDYN